MNPPKRETKGSPKASETVATHVVLPSDTNAIGSAFGGQIMKWMDIAASVAAMRHCGRPAVTLSVDDLTFARPIRLGDIVVLRASVNFVGNTSMEVGVRVEREDPRSGVHEHALSGYFTFVALGDDGKPTPASPVTPLSEAEHRRFAAALSRHARRKRERLAKTQQ